MMVMVDTTVWVDFFHARPLSHVEMLESMLANGDDICICGIVLTEVLQGIRRDAEFRSTRNLFSHLLFVPMQYTTFVEAAEIYRHLRQNGITIRKTVDCMIAAAAIENGISLLHNDRDFDFIRDYSGLKTIS